MGGYSFEAITCAICVKPLNLRADLCADENGKAVHEECYVKRITTPRSCPPVAWMSVGSSNRPLPDCEEGETLAHRVKE